MRPLKGIAKIASFDLAGFSRAAASLFQRPAVVGQELKDGGMARNKAQRVGQDAAAPQHPQGAIDLDHLARQAMGDPGLADEVLRLYAQMSAVYLERIEASTTVPVLLEHLHTLKCAASGIGAWGVRDLTRRAEDELRAGAPVNPERIADIAMAVEECGAFIAALVDSDTVLFAAG